jgi:cytoskeleton protein RodZ
MASLLRKARNRRREPLPIEIELGETPRAPTNGIGVSAEAERDHAPPSAAKHTHSAVGSLLRDAREQRGLDVEGVARALRIRHPYLVAIEEGRYGDLPGAPYASGFVRSYAEFLGLDGNEILRRFREESGGQAARSELVFPQPVSEGGFPAAVFIGVVIVAAAVIYGIWYFYQWHHGGSAESVSEVPDRLAALIHEPAGEAHANSGTAQAASPKAPAQAKATSPDDSFAPSAQFEAAKSSGAKPGTATPTPISAATAQQPDLSVSAPPQTAIATPAPVPVPAPAATPTPPAPAASAVPANPPVPPAPDTSSVAPSTQPAPAAESPHAPAVVADATPAPPVVTQIAPPPAPVLGPPSRVVLRASEDCWIEIRDAGGEIITSRLLHRGDAFPVPPQAGATLTVGNAGALVVLLDGNALPPLGKTGMVRHDVPIDPERLTGPSQCANPGAPMAPAPAAAPIND